jgi:hypothetical protein
METLGVAKSPNDVVVEMKSWKSVWRGLIGMPCRRNKPTDGPVPQDEAT